MSEVDSKKDTNFETLRPGILKSRDYFNSLIKAEIEKGIPSSRIVLGKTISPSTGAQNISTNTLQVGSLKEEQYPSSPA